MPEADLDMMAADIEELPPEEVTEETGTITEEQLGYADTLGWDERKLEAFLALVATTQALPGPEPIL